MQQSRRTAGKATGVMAPLGPLKSATAKKTLALALVHLGKT